MSITTTGKLADLLSRCAPNSKLTVVINGTNHEIQRIRWRTESMEVQIHASALSDEDLFGEPDGEKILDENLDDEI